MLTTKGKTLAEKKPLFANFMGNGRKVIHMEGLPKGEEERILKLIDSLRDFKDNRTVDISKVVNEAFPLFEATIDAANFQKVKKFYGIGYKNPQKNTGKPGEINILLAKLKTIENAMSYVDGFKEVIEGCASKLLYAPDEMDMITRAKLVILYYRVFFNHEQFVEDYVQIMGKVQYSEAQALKNNSEKFGPEEIFVLYHNKVKHTEGIFYDAIVYEIGRLDKHVQSEVFELSEIDWDNNLGRFISVNKCMVSPTFAKIRLLKKKCADPRPFMMLERFAGKALIDSDMDITILYNIYKMLTVTPWKEFSSMESMTIRTLSGSIFVDKEQEYYKPWGNLCIADDVEAGRWTHLMHYLACRNYVIKTEIDFEGNLLPEPKFYNVGAFWGAISFAYDMSYIGSWSTSKEDFDTADKLLAMENAEDIFIRYKDETITSDKVIKLLGITEEYAKNELSKFPDVKAMLDEVRAAAEVPEEPVEAKEVPITVYEYVIPKKDESDDEKKFVVRLPHVTYENAEDFSLPEVTDNELPDIGEKSGRVVYMMIESLIRHALCEGYIEYPDEVFMDAIMEIFIPNHQASVMSYRAGSIGDFGLESQCGIPEGFGEGFFNQKKLDIKKIEELLMKFRSSSSTKKDRSLYFDNRGIVRLYCYIISNKIACGPKMKVPKGNSALKPKILMTLID